jgi:hypothetical protein
MALHCAWKQELSPIILYDTSISIKFENTLAHNYQKRFQLGFHAFTGCGQNSTFSRRGKKGPFGVLKNYVQYQNAFASLGTSEELSDETIFILGKVTCEIFPKRGRQVAASTVNEARLIAFLKEFKPSKKNPLSEIKGIDGSNMPPLAKQFFFKK